MGGFWDFLNRIAGVPDSPPPTATFSSVPMPIDQMFLEMRGSTGPVSKAEALSVPAVMKGRNLLCSISTLPLLQKDSSNVKVRNPLFEQFDPDVPNVVHLSQTIEDLVLEAIAWWRVTGFGFDGYPMTVRRLEPKSVSLHPPGSRKTPAPLPSGEDPRGAVVWVDGQPVPANEIIRFDSPNPAVLTYCARSIRRAIRFDKAAERYARNPRPLDYFSPVEGQPDPVDDDEIAEILSEWKQARQTESTAYVPAALKYNTVDVASPADLQLAELQKQVGLDLANALSVDPEDLGISTTSRTYQNDVDRRRDRINDVLAPYMRAITDRLSMPDVTKRGYRAEFDLTDYMKSNPTERWMTYEKGKNLGVYTEEEIREMEGLPPMDRPAQPSGSSVQDPNPAPQGATPQSVDASRVDYEHEWSMIKGGIFAGEDDRLTFTEPSTMEFAVDRETRIVEGVVVPYGKVGLKYGMKFSFRRNSLQWVDPKRVKLLRDHDFKQALGYAIELKDTPVGLYAKFKVARGPEGDRALELAEDGVLDGLSVGVDFDPRNDTEQSSRDRSVLDVVRGDLREVSLTPMPAFDDARVTRVAASLTGGTMDETATSGQAPQAGTATETFAAPAVTLSADQFAELMRTAAGNTTQTTTALAPDGTVSTEPEVRPTVNPTRLTASVSVNEAIPYRFDRGGNFLPTEHVFSADLHEMARSNDVYGMHTDSGKRVMALLRATFDVDSADVTDLNPTIQRPDMYVDQREYRTPLWNFVNKGAPPDGINPFRFPKFNSASGLVGDHTQGTEPDSGTFTATGQTVTPTALSGKASITREVWDMGGNPAVSTLIFNQMVRGYREGLESATATFLNTLTAAADITITTAATDEQLVADWESALADLQFVRGYDFQAFALEKVLYKRFVSAKDTTERPIYPIIGPVNANGQATSRFQTVNLGGVTGVPSWALPSTPGSPNNSWLFDPTVVHGWATTPQRLEFPGTDTSGEYAPVAMVDIAIWGYKAFANSDIGGVRQVIHDSTA